MKERIWAFIWQRWLRHEKWTETVSEYINVMSGEKSKTKTSMYHVPFRYKRTCETFYDKVIKVRGWRTAIVERYRGGRSTITPMFFWERCGRPWWQYRQDLWRMVFGKPKT